jgi:hypothetical protein
LYLRDWFEGDYQRALSPILSNINYNGFVLFSKVTSKITNRNSEFGGVFMSELEPLEYETGTAIRDYDIIEITKTTNGYEVILDINLDSGYSLIRTKLEITDEDLVGYDSTEIEEGIKYALGFFENFNGTDNSAAIPL